MLKGFRSNFFVIALATVLISLSPALLRADDVIEKAGVGIELTAGNLVFLPAKAISTSMGLASGFLSFLLTGNADLTTQIWQDTTQGPYVITPELAKKSVGERPELVEKK